MKRFLKGIWSVLGGTILWTLIILFSLFIVALTIALIPILIPMGLLAGLIILVYISTDY